MKIDPKYNECFSLLNDHLATLTCLEAWYEILQLAIDNADQTWINSLINAINSKLTHWPVEDRMIPFWRNIPSNTFKIVRFIRINKYSCVNFQTFSRITEYRYIKRLDILYCEEVLQFKQFIHSPYTSGLEHLTIRGSGIPSKDLVELCKSPLIKQLSSLTIGGELPGRFEYLEGLCNQELENLKNLSFQNLGLCPPYIENYLSRLSTPNLENLDLRGNYDLNTATVIKLLNYDNFMQLKNLNLRRTMITQRDLEVINKQINHNVNIEVSSPTRFIQ